MRIKRFDTLNEAAKKPAKKELEKKVLDFLTDELKKQKMSRYDIIKKIKEKFKGEKDIDNIAGKTATDVTHDPLNKKLNIKSESYINTIKDNKKEKYSVACYFIGDSAKEPVGKIKQEDKPKKEKKEEDKPKKSSKVSRFNDFESKKEKEAKKDAKKVLDAKKDKKAEDAAKDDIKDDKKKDKTVRQTNFEKDSLDQLYKKLDNDKYEEYWSEIKDEIAERPKKKGRK